MEGRQPPPKAEHPFPNNPDVYKFWGAPWGKTVMKGTFFAGCFFGSLLLLNNYITEGHPNLVGSFPPTKEEVIRKGELMRHHSYVNKTEMPVEFVHLVNKDLQFDDGVRFNPVPSANSVNERI